MGSPRCITHRGVALLGSTLVLTASLSAVTATAALAQDPVLPAAAEVPASGVEAHGALAVAPPEGTPAAQAPPEPASAPDAPAPVRVPPVDLPAAAAPAPDVHHDADRRNRPPVAADDRLVLPQGGSATIDLLANDVDADGDVLSVLGGTSAGHGTVSFVGGTATFTADPDFVGEDSFLYIAADGRGGASTGTVHITVTPVRQAAPAAKPWNTRPAAPQAAPAPVEVARQAAPKAVRPVAVRPVAVRPAGRAVVSRPQAATTVSAPVRRAPAAAPMGPSTTPYVAPAARPATLPFTGGPTDVLLPLGVGLLLTGGLLTATGRRRA